MVAYSILRDMLVINYDGKTQSIAKGDVRYDGVLKRIKANKLDEIPTFLESDQFRKGRITVKGDDVFIDDVKMPDVLKRKIVEFQQNGFPFSYLEKFWDKLKKNPNPRSRDHLYAFLEHNGHPITQTGNFIAYKKVRTDYRDIHSGTFLNQPNMIVKMDRTTVNQDPTQTCSNGLHVASWQYADKDYGGKDDVMIEVEVDPSNVVCVPNDYNGQKMRCCEYKVLGRVLIPETQVAKKVATQTGTTVSECTKRAEPAAKGSKEMRRVSFVERCFDSTGFVKFKELGDIMGISQIEMAEILLADVSTIRRGAKSTENQNRARKIVTVVDLVWNSQLFAEEDHATYVKKWFRERRKIWKNKTALQLMRKKSFEEVTSYAVNNK